jgi:hypothetical protein
MVLSMIEAELRELFNKKIVSGYVLYNFDIGRF